jgi:hypothetical protein
MGWQRLRCLTRTRVGPPNPAVVAATAAAEAVEAQAAATTAAARADARAKGHVKAWTLKPS